MSIPYPLAEIIIREALRKPFDGSALLFGRSAVGADLSALEALFDRLNFKKHPNVKVEVDTGTQLAKEYPEKKFIMDKTFLKWLGLKVIHSLDISNYEGADIQHDICKDLPDDLIGAYDFIFNSSVLDNVFDPCNALKNMMLALKPGGRAVHIEMATYDNLPYLVFSPGWFLDYYAINKFKYCQVYLAQYNTVEELKFGPWLVWGCLPLTQIKLSAPTMQGSKAVLIVIAERGENSTVDINPIQGHYRSENDQIQIDKGLKNFACSSLPFFINDEEKNLGLSNIQENYLWKWVPCGEMGR